MIIKDRFLRFTFNDISSEEFGVFYENNGEDISFPFSEVVKHKTTNPLFQGREYWLGSDKESKTISLNLAADKRQMEEMEEIFRWLDATKPGKLRFDFRDNYEFSVIITNLSEATLVPYEQSNGLIEMITKFTITFKTIGDHLLTTHQPYFIGSALADVIREPDQLLPIVTPSGGGQYQFNNWSGVKQNMKINVKGKAPKVFIGSYSDTLPSYSFSSNLSLVASVDTSIGALESGGTLFEIAHPTVEVSNVGPSPIKPGLVYGGKMEMQSVGNTITIPYNNRMGEVTLGAHRLAILPRMTKETNTKYFSRENGDLYTGLYPVVGGQIVLPKIAIGTYSSGKFVFSMSGIEKGVYDIKISETVAVKISGADEYSILMNYKKEV